MIWWCIAVFVALVSPVGAELPLLAESLFSSTSILEAVEAAGVSVGFEVAAAADSGSVVRFSIATVTLELESPLVPELGENVCCSSVV